MEKTNPQKAPRRGVTQKKRRQELIIRKNLWILFCVFASLHFVLSQFFLRVLSALRVEGFSQLFLRVLRVSAVKVFNDE